jgi:Peptidase A4 family
MRVVATVAVAAISAALAGTASGATRDIPSVSSNWSGYAISDAATIAGQPPSAPLTFSSVTATWIQPKVTCTPAADLSFSSFWVGLGGFAEDAPALEQIGTEADCGSGGTPVYFAWHELVPAASVQIPLRIRPGDTITASVNVHGTDVLVQVKNRTRRSSFTKHLQMASPDLTSAEWIAEAPSQCGAGSCRVLPLANFGSVAFSRIAAIANGHPGTMTDPAWTSLPIALVPDSARHSARLSGAGGSTAGATAAAVSPDGRTFSVAWVADASAAAAGP